jgi:hypothetical protein
MSGHVRFGLAAFFIVAGLAASASANPFTDLFAPSPPPEAAAAAAPAPAQEACARQPGPARAGQHWVYRVERGRKCWFMAAEGSALTSRLVRHRAASRRTAASGDDEPAPSKAVDDARDEVVNPPPAETPNQPPAPTLAEPKITVLHTVPVQEADAAAPVTPPPASGAQGAGQPTPDQPTSDEPRSDQPRSDQPTPDQQAPRHVDVEKLLNDAPAPADDAASAAAAMPVDAPVATTGGEGQEKGQENGQEKGMASWLGVLLMALGAAALLSSSRTIRHALRSVRWPGSSAELPVAAQGGYDDLAAAPEHIRFTGTRRDDLFRYEPKSVTPLARAGRTRRPVAPEAPAQEAF